MEPGGIDPPTMPARGGGALQTAIGLDIRLVAVAIGPIAVIAVIAGTIIATAGAAIGAAPTADRLNG